MGGQDRSLLHFFFKNMVLTCLDLSMVIIAWRGERGRGNTGISTGRTHYFSKTLILLVNSCYNWSKCYKALTCLWKKFTVQLSVITSSKDEAKPNHRDWLLSIFFFIININYPLCYIKLYNSIHLSTGLGKPSFKKKRNYGKFHN